MSPVTIWFTPLAGGLGSFRPVTRSPSSRTLGLLLSWQIIPRQMGGVDLLSGRGVELDSPDPPSLFIMTQTLPPIINSPPVLLWTVVHLAIVSSPNYAWTSGHPSYLASCVQYGMQPYPRIGAPGPFKVAVCTWFTPRPCLLPFLGTCLTA